MKKIIFLMALSFGFGAHAETVEYPLSQQCKQGEVAKAQSTVIPKDNGSFVVRVEAKCVPADCYVLGRTRDGVWQMTLAEHSSSESGSGTISVQATTDLAASSKREAKAEVQKLVDQGYCRKAVFYSSWDSL